MGALRYYRVLTGTPPYSRSALGTQEVPALCSRTHEAIYCSVFATWGARRIRVLTSYSHCRMWQHVCTAVWGNAEYSWCATALYFGYSRGTHAVLTQRRHPFRPTSATPTRPRVCRRRCRHGRRVLPTRRVRAMLNPPHLYPLKLRRPHIVLGTTARCRCHGSAEWVLASTPLYRVKPSLVRLCGTPCTVGAPPHTAADCAALLGGLYRSGRVPCLLLDRGTCGYSGALEGTPQRLRWSTGWVPPGYSRGTARARLWRQGSGPRVPCCRA